MTATEPPYISLPIGSYSLTHVLVTKLSKSKAMTKAQRKKRIAELESRLDSLRYQGAIAADRRAMNTLRCLTQDSVEIVGELLHLHLQDMPKQARKNVVELAETTEAEGEYALLFAFLFSVAALTIYGLFIYIFQLS